MRAVFAVEESLVAVLGYIAAVWRFYLAVEGDKGLSEVGERTLNNLTFITFRGSEEPWNK